MKKRIIQYLSIALTLIISLITVLGGNTNIAEAAESNTLIMHLQDFDSVVKTLEGETSGLIFRYWKLPDEMSEADPEDTVIALHSLSEKELSKRYEPLSKELSFGDGYISVSSFGKGLYYARQIFSSDKLIYNSEFVFRFSNDSGTVTDIYPKKVEKGNIKGEKVWNDNGNRDGKRPESIVIRLYRDGREISSVTVTEKDNWKWTFVGINKYHNSVPAVYTISEDKVYGYTTKITGDVEKGFVVTNTPEYPPEKPNTGDITGKTIKFYGLILLLAAGVFNIILFTRKNKAKDDEQSDK